MVRLGVVWLEANRLPVTGDGLVDRQPAMPAQRVSQMFVRIGEIGLEAQSLPVTQDGLGLALLPGKRPRQSKVGLWVLRREAHSVLKVGDRAARRLTRVGERSLPMMKRLALFLLNPE